MLRQRPFVLSISQPVPIQHKSELYAAASSCGLLTRVKYRLISKFNIVAAKVLNSKPVGNRSSRSMLSENSPQFVLSKSESCTSSDQAMEPDLTGRDSAARSAVRKRVQEDQRKISAQQKAQDHGINLLLERQLTGSSLLENISANMHSNMSTYANYQDVNNKRDLDSDESTEGHTHVKRPRQIHQPPQKSKLRIGQAIFDQKMEPIFRKSRSRQTPQQNRVSRMTKDSGGACAEHKASKKSVSSSFLVFMYSSNAPKVSLLCPRG